MQFKKFANSLLTRMLTMGVLLALFGTAASYIQLTRFLREDLTQSVAAQQLALAGYVAHDVDGYLRDRQQWLERLAQGLPPALLTRPAALRAWLDERHALNPVFSLGLELVDLRGEALSGSRRVLEGLDLTGALEGRPTIGRPTRNPVSRQPALSMATPVKDDGGNVIAVLVGGTDLAADGLIDRLQQARVGRTGGILLISPRDHMFVASTDAAMSLTPTPKPGVNLLHDRAMAGYRGSGTTVNAFGVEEISAIASVPRSGWFVVARLPSAEALSPVARMQDFIVRRRLVGVLIALGLLGAVIAWLLRPLQRAADDAERMTQGRIPLAPLRVVRDDEIGHLTAAFNRLLGKLGEHQAELGRLAYHDSLTGLPNRKMLEDRLLQALAQARRHAKQVAVLYLDLDGFKKLNDTLGHDAGDEALKETALRLQAVVRQADTVVRLGGDEFVVLAADFEEPTEVGSAALANKCIAAVGRPLQLRAAETTLGVSIGIALSNGRHSPDELLAAADAAMYQAKQQGRGGFVIARP